MVATSALMNLDTTTFEELITNMFSKKGEKVVDMNIEALNEGYRLMKEHLSSIQGDFELEAINEDPHLYMIGNDAIGLEQYQQVLNLWLLILLLQHLKLWSI